MLLAIERALWYVNMAAAAVLFVRVYAQGLVKAYPFLFAYLFTDALEEVVALSFANPHRKTLYAEIYFAGQTAKAVLAVFVVLELYQLALVQQPALARFGRRMLGYLFSIAVAIGLVNLLFEVAPATAKRNAFYVGFLGLERSMDLVAFIVLILISGFLLWFPVRARRNVALWLGGFMIYSFSRWTGLLLSALWPWLTHPSSVAMLAISLICTVGWIVLLKKAGEKETVVTGHAWDRAQAERLTVQLDAINSRLVRVARTS
ncbi:MAG TPA: hypothetical protein VH639_26745 [Bryobacteraceae bacterium]|jgi:hypothetical protein